MIVLALAWFSAVTVLGDITTQETFATPASDCDPGEENSVIQQNVDGSAPIRKPCMSGAETEEDRWFKATICPKFAFECDEQLDAAECEKQKSEACEKLRTTWLGRFGVFSRTEIDTSGATNADGASNHVHSSDATSWFDNETPLYKYEKWFVEDRDFVEQKCGYGGQPGKQDLSPFASLIKNDQPLPTTCGANLPAEFTAHYENTLYGVLNYLLDTVYDEMDPSGAAFSGTERPLVRKDIRTLSDADRKKYLKAIKITNCLGLTKIWGAIHASSPSDMHSGFGFLPSHSVFMRVYELALQDFGGIGRGMAMHILGWTIDSTLPRWHNGRIRFSAIWGADYIGATAHQVLGQAVYNHESDVFDGKFVVSADGGKRDLLRTFRNVERRGGYVSPGAVWDMMAFDSPICLASYIEGGSIHGGPHMAVNGHMGNLLQASWDPAFFMHHAFVDCVWRSWQMQGSKSERATAESMPEPGKHWKRHRPSMSAHWTTYTSQRYGDARSITHANAWNYRNSGRGSYKCLVPSLAPCVHDEDCGVPAGVSREEKRVYCSQAGVCSQYVETNAICRNSYGSFLPCQKTTDRCQYSPTLFTKHNSGQRPHSPEKTLAAWYCVPQRSLHCGKNKNAASCADQGCEWLTPSNSDVQSCPTKVPAYGYGVVEEDTETVQSLGVEFDFLDQSLPEPSGAQWTLTRQGPDNKPVQITLRAIRQSEVGIEATPAGGVLSLSRNPVSFGIDDRSRKAGPTCDGNVDGYGDFPHQVDSDEALEITFPEPVDVGRVHIGNSGSNEFVELDVYLRGERVGHTSISGAIILCDDTIFNDCQVGPDGEKQCLADRIVLYHGSFLDASQNSAEGIVAADDCDSIYPGLGFSVLGISFSLQQVVQHAGSEPSAFEGFCTGPPNFVSGVNDYDLCANEDRCFMSAADGPDVEVILVPAGVCGPKGWRPMLELVEEEKDGERVLAGKYRSTCPCGAHSTHILTGEGPSDKMARYLPVFDLYRVQDRNAGNDDAFRKDKGLLEISASTMTLSALLMTAVTIIALF